MDHDEIFVGAQQAWEQINGNNPIEHVLLMNVLQSLIDSIEPHGGAITHISIGTRSTDWTKHVAGRFVLENQTIEFDLYPCKKKSAVRYTQRKKFFNGSLPGFIRKSTNTFTVNHSPEAIDYWFKATAKFSLKMINSARNQ